jgi:flagellar motor component MotA
MKVTMFKEDEKATLELLKPMFEFLTELRYHSLLNIERITYTLYATNDKGHYLEAVSTERLEPILARLSRDMDVTEEQPTKIPYYEMRILYGGHFIQNFYIH